MTVFVCSHFRPPFAAERRGGAEEPPAEEGAGAAHGQKAGRGAGASSAAGDLLELFVESVRLLASLCQERHEDNISLVRSLKGTTYKVKFDVVSSSVVGRGAG